MSNAHGFDSWPVTWLFVNRGNENFRTNMLMGKRRMHHLDRMRS